MTSNLGSEFLAGLEAGQPAEAAREQVMDVVRLAFRPEFLNRIDEILLFNRLVLDDMKSIVQIQLARLERLLEERRIHLTVDGAGKEWLAQKGYDPVYGARPLRRVIQRELQNPLASLILEGKVQDRISVTAKEGELILSC
jgi:ATP-dependent Clp protease ATP-binding subunit ClpB